MFFAWLDTFCRLTTRFEHLRMIHLSFISRGYIMILLKTRFEMAFRSHFADDFYVKCKPDRAAIHWGRTENRNFQ